MKAAINLFFFFLSSYSFAQIYTTPDGDKHSSYDCYRSFIDYEKSFGSYDPCYSTDVPIYIRIKGRECLDNNCNVTWTSASGLITASGTSEKTSSYFQNVYKVQSSENKVNTTYTARVLSSRGCWLEASFPVSVPPPKLTPISVTPSNVSICLGGNVTLTASGTNPEPYQWYNNSGTLIGTGAQITVTPASSTNYKARVINSSNCKTEGNASITVKPIPTGVNFDNPIEAGTVAIGSTYSSTRNNAPSNCFANDYSSPNGQLSDDIFYRFSIAQDSKVTLSHCGSGLGDTYLHLFDSNRNRIAFNDDYGPVCNTYQSSISMNLAPGTYYVVSEGYSYNFGDITTSIKVDPCDVNFPGRDFGNPVIISNDLLSCFNYTDKKNTGACTINNYGRYVQDVVYKFTATTSQTINISTCNSEVNDTYLTLLDGNKAFVTSNDDGGGTLY